MAYIIKVWYWLRRRNIFSSNIKTTWSDLLSSDVIRDYFSQCIVIRDYFSQIVLCVGIIISQNVLWSVVNAAQLTGSVKPGKNWQLNFWIWILQAEENHVRIQYSIKIWTLFRSFYFFSRIFTHSHFANAYDFLAFPILIFTGQHSGF